MGAREQSPIWLLDTVAHCMVLHHIKSCALSVRCWVELRCCVNAEEIADVGSLGASAPV